MRLNRFWKHSTRRLHKRATSWKKGQPMQTPAHTDMCTKMYPPIGQPAERKDSLCRHPHTQTCIQRCIHPSGNQLKERTAYADTRTHRRVYKDVSTHPPPHPHTHTQSHTYLMLQAQSTAKGHIRACMRACASDDNGIYLNCSSWTFCTLFFSKHRG